jgi:hypothetical protein
MKNAGLWDRHRAQPLDLLQELDWLGFLDAFRTLCIDPKEEIWSVLEEVRAQ